MLSARRLLALTAPQTRSFSAPKKAKVNFAVDSVVGKGPYVMAGMGVAYCMHDGTVDFTRVTTRGQSTQTNHSHLYLLTTVGCLSSLSFYFFEPSILIYSWVFEPHVAATAGAQAATDVLRAKQRHHHGE